LKGEFRCTSIFKVKVTLYTYFSIRGKNLEKMCGINLRIKCEMLSFAIKRQPDKKKNAVNITQAHSILFNYLVPASYNLCFSHLHARRIDKLWLHYNHIVNESMHIIKEIYLSKNTLKKSCYAHTSNAPTTKCFPFSNSLSFAILLDAFDPVLKTVENIQSRKIRHES